MPSVTSLRRAAVHHATRQQAAPRRWPAARADRAIRDGRDLVKDRLPARHDHHHQCSAADDIQFEQPEAPVDADLSGILERAKTTRRTSHRERPRTRSAAACIQQEPPAPVGRRSAAARASRTRSTTDEHRRGLLRRERQHPEPERREPASAPRPPSIQRRAAASASRKNVAHSTSDRPLM